MANNGGMEATAPAWNDQDTSNLHRTAERDTILEELLVKARKENEDIARRMRKILGEDIGGSIDGSVVEKLPALKQTESLEVKDTHTSKLTAFPANTHRTLQNSPKVKNATNEPIERLLARAREEGYSNGWKAGKAVGYKIGLEDGQDIGMTEGKQIGFAQGKTAGLKEAKDQFQKGKQEYFQDWSAWENGFQQGLELGILRERGEWPQEYAPAGAQRKDQA